MLSHSGIYQIRNTVNGKLYVGSAKRLGIRWRQHLSVLRRRKHHSRHLQSAWDKHGEQAFVFEPLLVCSPSDLLFYEQRAFDGLKPQYNISPTAGNCLGVPCSPEKRAKISQAHMGKVLSPEHRAKVVAVLAAARSTPEFREASRERACHLGKLPQTREAARKRMLGRNVLPEVRAKISAARKGKPMHVNLSPELTARRLEAIREYNRTRPITQELRQNMSAGQKKRKGIEYFEYLGEMYTVLQLSELSGVADRHTIRKRLNAGWTVEKAVLTPARTYGDK